MLELGALEHAVSQIEGPHRSPLPRETAWKQDRKRRAPERELGRAAKKRNPPKKWFVPEVFNVTLSPRRRWTNRQRHGSRPVRTALADSHKFERSGHRQITRQPHPAWGAGRNQRGQQPRTGGSGRAGKAASRSRRRTPQRVIRRSSASDPRRKTPAQSWRKLRWSELSEVRPR